MPAELRDLGFLHLGRPESGVRRYGQLIADDGPRRRRTWSSTRPRRAAWTRARVDWPRWPPSSPTRRSLFMQWNRRGWGKHGGSLLRLMRFRRAYRGALVVTLHDIFERHGLRERYLAPDAWSLRWLGRVGRPRRGPLARSRWSGCAASSRPIACASSPTSSSVASWPLRPEEARARLGLADRRIVTLLGFVYGRKGHRYAVEAVPHLPEDVVMVYAGGPVAGRSFVHDLALAKAEELGLGDRFRITGYLSEEELETWIAATHLAILPFTDLSASGSMSSWIAAGKPMLVSDLPSVREYEPRAPGALHLFSPPEPLPLAAAIREPAGRAAARTPTRPCSGWPRSSAWSGRWSATWPWPGRRWPSVGPEGQLGTCDEHHWATGLARRRLPPDDRLSPGAVSRAAGRPCPCAPRAGRGPADRSARRPPSGGRSAAAGRGRR